MKVASIFTGCGGLDLGLEQVRARDATARVGGGPCVRRGGGVGEVPAIAVTVAPRNTPRHNKKQAGHEIILQCECDPGAQQVLRQRFPGTLLVKDVCALSALPPVRVSCVVGRGERVCCRAPRAA